MQAFSNADGRCDSGRALAWTVFLLALVTHLTYFAADPQNYAIDSSSYLTSSQNWLAGHGFSNAFLQPEAVRTPGYPLFLAAFLFVLPKIRAVIAVQHLLSAIFAGLTAAMAMRLTRNPLVAGITGAVLMTDLPTLYTSNRVLTESVYLPVLLAAFWLAYRAVQADAHRVSLAMLSGVFAGCGVLVRPVGILYCVALASFLFLALGKRAWQAAFALLLSFAVLPGLWALRNYHSVGVFTVTTLSASNMYRYRAAGALAAEQPGSYSDNLIRVRNELEAEACRKLEQKYGVPCVNITEAQRADYYVRAGRSIVLHHMRGYLKSAALGMANTVFGGGAEALTRITPLSRPIATTLLLSISCFYAVFAAIGCVYWYQTDRNMLWLVLLSLGYFLVISAGPEAYSRFRVPVMPMYALLIGGGVFQFARWVNKRRNVLAASS